jgi:ribosomal protein S13
MLKEKLKAIKDNEYMPIDGDLSLLNEMLDHIGDPDDHLRDDLIYPILATWLMKVLKSEDKQLVLNKCLHNLKHGLGEAGTDTVFTRSFSMLQIAVILYTHEKEKDLTEKQLQIIIDEFCDYLPLEHDLRGYVTGKGWAHSIAHAADVVKYLSQLELTQQQIGQLLQVVKQKMMVDYASYSYDEDERMAMGVVTLLDKFDLAETWIKSFQQIPKKKALPDDVIVLINTKNFLRCLYFRSESIEVKGWVLESLNAIDRYKR